MIRQIKLLCLLLALGFQSIQAQEHKHAGLTGKEKTIVIQPTRLNYEYTLRVVVTNCEIDGNIYVNCGPNGQSVATYHVICENGQWVWGCGGYCYEHGGGQALYNNCGITQQDLIDLVLMIHDADTCCRGTGPGSNPCDTTENQILNSSDYSICNRIDIVCCGNALKIIYTIYNCEDENEIISLDEFWALYNGDGITFDNPNDYTIVGILGTFSNGLRSRILAKVLTDNSNPCNIESNSNTND